MTINRRTILKATGLTAALTAMPVSAGKSSGVASQPARRLRLLVLGGTRYLGPSVVRSALARGHELTLFNRGQTRPDLFPGIPALRGNRFPEKDMGLSALKTGEWDAVLDLCGQYPRIVDASARLLNGRVGRYVMVSSISVYRDFRTIGLDEQAELRAVPETFEEFPDLVENDWGTYGGRKAGGEAAAQQIFGDRTTIVRPCSICGGENNDGTGAYWPSRLFHDQTVLLPGDGSDPTQLIDVDDVADFIILAVERDLGGAYNLVGPADRLTFGEYIAEASRVVGSRAQQIWRGEFPEDMYGLPLAPPFSLVPGFATMSNAKARAAGLQFRPLHDTIMRNWLDHRSRRPADYDFAAAGIGLSRDNEAAVLKQLLSKR